MTEFEEGSIINLICPHCKESFRKHYDLPKKESGILTTILLKNHSNGSSCPPFVAFIDSNGRHRGSQKIDNFEIEDKINDQILESARDRISELDKMFRLYHLKIPRKGGRGFEHKVANVGDRVFMGSIFYQKLIEFLSENEEENTFGTISIEKTADFEGGMLIYGKFFGMIYTIFWKDQKNLLEKKWDDLRGFANLTVEKLLDVYDLMDLF